MVLFFMVASCNGGGTGTSETDNSDFSNRIKSVEAVVGFKIIVPEYLPDGLLKMPEVTVSEVEGRPELVQLEYVSPNQDNLLRITEFESALESTPEGYEQLTVNGNRVHLREMDGSNQVGYSGRTVIGEVGISIEYLASSGQTPEEARGELIRLLESMKAP
jgi:hypothetical protein